jgi:hypothetical protein
MPKFDVRQRQVFVFSTASWDPRSHRRHVHNYWLTRNISYVICMICLHTKLHAPRSNGASLITVKLTGKSNFFTSSLLKGNYLIDIFWSQPFDTAVQRYSDIAVKDAKLNGAVFTPPSAMLSVGCGKRVLPCCAVTLIASLVRNRSTSARLDKTIIC